MYRELEGSDIRLPIAFNCSKMDWPQVADFLIGLGAVQLSVGYYDELDHEGSLRHSQRTFRYFWRQGRVNESHLLELKGLYHWKAPILMN